MHIVHETKLVKIRKPHKCIGCLRIFQPGNYMFLQVVNDSGEIYNVYWCKTCDNLMYFLEPYENLWQESFVLNEMESDNFQGTPEQYLKYLDEQHFLKYGFYTT